MREANVSVFGAEKTIWICKRKGKYLACDTWDKALLGIASPSYMFFLTQEQLRQLFERNNAS